MSGHLAAEGFADVARRYVAVLDARHGQPAEDLLLAVHPLLVELAYRASLLPEVDVDDDAPGRARMTHLDWQRLYESLGEQLGELNLYWDVSDPVEPDERERASLVSFADDLADIYRDVGDGLPDAGQPVPVDAAWNWRFTFYLHWGEHALRAARAIQTRIAFYDLGEHEEDDGEGA